MRGVILSDIHGNWPALESVSRMIKKDAPDFIYCTGDIVGYNPFPVECVQWVRENCNLALQGNHDLAVSTRGSRPYGMREIAKKAAIYSYNELAESDLVWLKELPLIMRMDILNSTFVHSGNIVPSAWWYILNSKDATVHMRMMETQFLFIGHSHKPVIWTEGWGSRNVRPKEQYRLSADRKHIINVGSVGQPRDGDPRACYTLVDFYQKKLVVTYRRVVYDVEATAKAFQRWQIDSELADRLLIGK